MHGTLLLTTQSFLRLIFYDISADNYGPLVCADVFFEVISAAVLRRKDVFLAPAWRCLHFFGDGL